MYSINPNYVNYSTTAVMPNRPDNRPKKAESTPFAASLMQVPAVPPYIRTQLSSKEEKEQYNALLNSVDKQSRKSLETMLKTGTLLNAESNDHSTVLANLYKIASTPRAEGLKNDIILRDTIAAIADPYVINQEFGDVPAPYAAKTTAAYNELKKTALTNVPEDVANVHSGTCVASSVEFTLAQRQPAEYARFAEGLSSPAVAVNKTIKFSNLADSTLDAVWLLNAFEIPFEAHDFENINLKFAPDKNALLRAQIQTTHKDPLERSAVDALMQSTFMQVGSQQSYDSLTDKRAGKFNQNDKGLIEFEKTFTESVVEDKNKISVTYQKVDENARLTGYEADFATMKKQIIAALNMHENVIIGYTLVDANNKIINGHEITITGVRQDKQGKLIFICNDTDDNLAKPVEYSEDWLLPKIHHAALPKAVLEKDMNMTENWVEGMKNYKEMKSKTRKAA